MHNKKAPGFGAFLFREDRLLLWGRGGGLVGCLEAIGFFLYPSLLVLAHYQAHLAGLDVPLSMIAFDVVPHLDLVHKRAIALAHLAMATLSAGEYDLHKAQLY